MGIPDLVKNLRVIDVTKIQISLYLYCPFHENPEGKKAFLVIISTIESNWVSDILGMTLSYGVHKHTKKNFS